MLNTYWRITPKSNPITGYSYTAVADDSWISNPQGENRGGREMKITSILRLKDSKQFGCLSKGLYYSKAFGDKFRSEANNSKVTTALKQHLNDPVRSTASTFNKAFKSSLKLKQFNNSIRLLLIFARSWFCSENNNELSFA